MLPRLVTDRLVLHPGTEGDAVRLWRLWTDRDVRRYLWDDRIIEEAEARETLGRFSDAAARGLGLWTLWRHEDDTFVGHCALRPLSDPAAAEVIVALERASWHRGYATEALGALRSHAFETLRLARLEAATDQPNHASQRLLERVGFTHIGTSPRPRFPLLRYELRRAHRQR